MEVSSQLLIVIAYVFHSCSASILVKFGRLPLHYARTLKNGTRKPDPLENFDLASRQLLCDAVINARQFALKYSKKYVTPKINLIWGLPPAIADATWNYQRSSHASAPALEYKPHRTQMARGFGRIKSLCCVYTKTIKWYLTFGLVDHFLYLLEHNDNENHPTLLITGMLEPSALVSQTSVLYLRSQLVKGKARMESIWKLSNCDKLRVCGAISDALRLGNDARMNYVKKNSHKHATRKLHPRYGDDRLFKFLQCSFIRGESESESYYVLADYRDSSAVFAFLPDETGRLKMVARLIKIGVFVNPVGPGYNENAETNEKDFPAAETDGDNSCKMKRKLGCETTLTEARRSTDSSVSHEMDLGEQDAKHVKGRSKIEEKTKDVARLLGAEQIFDTATSSRKGEFRKKLERDVGTPANSKGGERVKFKNLTDIYKPE